MNQKPYLTIKSLIGMMIFILLYSSVFAQEDGSRESDDKDFVYTVKAGPGKVLKAYSRMPETELSFFTAYEFARQANGMAAWEQQLNYPEYGVEILFGSLNNDFLGNVVGVQPFLRWHLTNKSAPLKLSFTAGLGFSYFTNPYHPVDNPENALVGSHVTNYTRGEFEVSYQYQHVRLFASLGAFHFSNGHVKLPNIGANVPQAKIGLSYLTKSEPTYSDAEFIYPDKWQYELGFLSGMHSYGATTKPYGGPVYPVYSIRQTIGKNLSPVYRIGFGVVAGHYRSFYRFIENELKDTENPWNASVYMTAFFAQEMCMGHVSLYGEFGIDLMKPFLRRHGDIFNPETGSSAFIKQWNSNRLGLKYYLRDTKLSGWNVSFGVFIKANYAQADFAECAINFRF